MSFIAPNNPSDVTQELAELGYLASEGLSSSIFLSLSLQRPLFLEGDPGVGKTEVAKTLAKWAQTDLIRLQCFASAVRMGLYKAITPPPSCRSDWKSFKSW